MSLLLDALRKSEAQRQRGQAPSLELASMPSSMSSPARRFPWIAIVVVAVAATLAVWMVGRWQESRLDASQDRIIADANLPEPAVVVEPVAGTNDATVTGGPVPAARMRPIALAPEEMMDGGSRDPEAAGEDARTAAIEQPAAAASTAASRTTAAGPATPEASEPGPADIARVAQAPARPARAPAPDNRTAVSEQPDAIVDAAADEREGRPQPRLRDPASDPGDFRPIRDQGQSMQQNFIRPWELPQDLRASFPDLKMTVHFYADRVQDRFVLINGTRYGQGDSITDRASLKEISRRGAIIEFDQYRILIE